jgi:3-phenylpropionate/trans-cinnamate dioxygenase ferredoxin subunit
MDGDHDGREADPLIGTVRDGWTDLGVVEINEGELRALEVDGHHVLLAKHKGTVSALDDMCNHAGCLLSGGWIDAKNGSVVCPCHEIEFDLRTGKNLTVPRLCEDQIALPLRLEAGRALVQLGKR